MGQSFIKSARKIFSQSGGEGVLFSSTVQGTIAAAQVNTLDTIPVVVIPAPGANKIIILNSVIGVRKAVYAAVFNNYTDIAAIGNGSSAAGTTWINGDLIVTNAGLNSAAHVQAISAVAPVDAVSTIFVLKVAIDGTVTAYADGVSYPIYSAGTTTMDFDAGDELIPFYQIVNIGGGDPAASISAFYAIPDAQAIV